MQKKFLESCIGKGSSHRNKDREIEYIYMLFRVIGKNELLEELAIEFYQKPTVDLSKYKMLKYL